MKTKLLSIMSLIVVAMCAVFISCSEDMGYGENKENAQNEMLFLAAVEENYFNGCESIVIESVFL